MSLTASETKIMDGVELSIHDIFLIALIDGTMDGWTRRHIILRQSLSHIWLSWAFESCALKISNNRLIFDLNKWFILSIWLWITANAIQWFNKFSIDCNLQVISFNLPRIDNEFIIKFDTFYRLHSLNSNFKTV